MTTTVPTPRVNTVCAVCAWCDAPLTPPDFRQIANTILCLGCWEYARLHW